jgi:UDP-N-acetylmuramate dehydrogenase
MEAKQSIVSVAVYDTATGKHYNISNEDSRFGYRDSRYKHEPNLIITSVTFRVHSKGVPRVEYSDLQTAHTAGIPLTTPKEIADAVRTIRSKKFPDLTTYGTAGSFFKNPILSEETFIQLSSRFGALPSFPAVNGIKIPLAFILDKALDLKGYKKGHTFLFGNQPLVLVAEAGATAEDVNSLAGEIERRVQEEIGITIEREVRNLSSHQSF